MIIENINDYNKIIKITNKVFYDGDEEYKITNISNITNKTYRYNYPKILLYMFFIIITLAVSIYYLYTLGGYYNGEVQFLEKILLILLIVYIILNLCFFKVMNTYCLTIFFNSGEKLNIKSKKEYIIYYLNKVLNRKVNNKFSGICTINLSTGEYIIEEGDMFVRNRLNSKSIH